MGIDEQAAEAFFERVRTAMADAEFDCPLAESHAVFGATYYAIDFRNPHAEVSFSVEPGFRLTYCQLALWRRDVYPPNPEFGSQFVLTEFGVAALDDGAPRFFAPDELRDAVPYWVGLLREKGQAFLCGDHRRLAQVLHRLESSDSIRRALRFLEVEESLQREVTARSVIEASDLQTELPGF